MTGDILKAVLPWALVGAAAIALALYFGGGSVNFGVGATGCNVKGNISVRTGERIYHVPGQRYYSATRVNWLRGERWFCSEAEARRAGWRRSRV